jgi:hypothetical protein
MRPQFMKSIFHPRSHTKEEHGLYILRFWIDNEIVDVEIDDRIWCYKGTKRPSFAKSINPDDKTFATWPLLLEKAWAKLHGSWGAVGNGMNTAACMAKITNGLAFNQSLEDEDMKKKIKNGEFWSTCMD